MKLFKLKRASSVLGIALDGDRLEAAVVRRSGGGVQLQKSVSAANVSVRAYADKQFQAAGRDT